MLPIELDTALPTSVHRVLACSKSPIMIRQNEAQPDPTASIEASTTSDQVLYEVAASRPAFANCWIWAICSSV